MAQATQTFFTVQEANVMALARLIPFDGSKMFFSFAFSLPLLPHVAHMSSISFQSQSCFYNDITFPLCDQVSSSLYLAGSLLHLRYILMIQDNYFTLNSSI